MQGEDIGLREILIFGGTTEGRRLSELLAKEGMAHTVCVATAYGEEVMETGPGPGQGKVRVHQGRMDREQIREFIQKGGYGAVVDATHPYAREATCNIRQAAEDAGTPYLRLARERARRRQGGDVSYFDSHEECADALSRTEGKVLLTIGSGELEKYCADGLRERLYVRILPCRESLALCEARGIRGSQILAMQGPFSVELNEAILRQYRISCLVTKESGTEGGYPGKLEAASRAGAAVFVVGRPPEEGDSFAEVCRRLGAIAGREFSAGEEMEITLAGVGMGDRKELTGEVREAVESADILLGAKRLLESLGQGKECRPYYLAGQIVPFLEKIGREGAPGVRRIAVLFSGDSGFYSGCGKLYKALLREREAGRLRASLRILPGISAVSRLAALTGESYEDAAVYSMHGRELPNLARRIERNARTFLLMSGAEDVKKLGRSLLEAGMEHCRVIVGFRLGGRGQRIGSLTPGECLEVREKGLYTCLVLNPAPVAGRLAPGMKDGDFLRDETPMSKEEVREVSICKLRLQKDAVVYDIGSGTGSVAVEIASLCDDIRVYALERSAEAAGLTRRNRDRYRLENLTVVEAEAPGGFRNLPAPTHVFIGGSGGRLEEILGALYETNPRARVVVNAVTLETLTELERIRKTFPTEQEELVQIQASRMRTAGHYHMMQAENPVWIMAFTFAPKEERSCTPND